MSNKVEVTLLESLNANDSAAVLSLNNNFLALQEAINNTLSRDGSVPNFMNAVLDMNGYRIINTTSPVYDSDFVTLGYLKQQRYDITSYVDRAEAAANNAEAANENVNELATIVSNDVQGIENFIEDFEDRWKWYKFENVEWSGEFVSNADSEVFVYKSTMQFDDVDDIADTIPNVMFDASDVESGNFAPYASTSVDGLTIYTKEPVVDLVIPAILFQ